MQNVLISVIIPCYNASKYITDTIYSILKQQGVTIEIIIIDDGSTDHSAQLIKEITDHRISYHFQENQGVSAARNKGFSYSKGEYIIFFDADDIMPPNFILSRLNYLITNNQLDFISGKVKKFNETELLAGNYRGTSENIFEEILYYNQLVVTCPSNYMFKRNFLSKHSLCFNEKLSSTADRFFILQCATAGKSFNSNQLEPLHYRVSINSMSHLLSHQLVNDNAIFYSELIASNLIPDTIKNKSLFLGNYILAKSYIKLNQPIKAIPYLADSLLKNPMLFLKKIIRA